MIFTFYYKIYQSETFISDINCKLRKRHEKEKLDSCLQQFDYYNNMEAANEKIKWVCEIVTCINAHTTMNAFLHIYVHTFKINIFRVALSFYSRILQRYPLKNKDVF